MLTEHVGRETPDSELDDRAIHDRDLGWLRSADAVVAEVSTPSLGVGYELALAESWGKPVLALHRRQRGPLSALVAGAPGIEVAAYGSLEEARALLDEFLRRRAPGEPARA